MSSLQLQTLLLIASSTVLYVFPNSPHFFILIFMLLILLTERFLYIHMSHFSSYIFYISTTSFLVCFFYTNLLFPLLLLILIFLLLLFTCPRCSSRHKISLLTPIIYLFITTDFSYIIYVFLYLHFNIHGNLL